MKETNISDPSPAPSISAMEEEHDVPPDNTDDVLRKDGDDDERHLRQGSQDGDSPHGDAAVTTTATSATATTTDCNHWMRFREEISFHRLLRGISKFRRLCGAAVNHDKVQIGIVTLIGINAIMMGVATFDFVTNNPEIDGAFETVDLVFLIVFTIELALQLIYHGLKLFLDGWLVFDFVVIVASWSLSSVQIIRAFRIFRALRLVTRVKMMKNLVLAVFNVMPKMAAIGLLLALIFYIFAVMMTQMFKGSVPRWIDGRRLL
ncbi:ion transport protein [Fragilaria crotonensis]|nr:ion transport protein [Fragilaria crotonensis]